MFTLWGKSKGVYWWVEFGQRKTLAVAVLAVIELQAMHDSRERKNPIRRQYGVKDPNGKMILVTTPLKV
jgi:hypothetical protein